LKAVLFDLDDTLYDHASFVREAYRDVAEAFARHTGLDGALFLDRIWNGFLERTGRCHTLFREALAASGCPGLPLETQLVEAYRKHIPVALDCFPGVLPGLDRLRGKVKLGLLTDGQPELQRRKIAALGLAQRFDAILVTGDLGRSAYKPAVAGFQEILARLEADPEQTVMVGDDPLGDVAGALAAGITPVRIRSGQYRHEASPVPCQTLDSIAGALAWIQERISHEEPRP
jgi:putative hydrolase of the HAD superfamily